MVREQFRKYCSHAAGFTLTEVIVVVAMISIVTAIAVPLMGPAIRRSDFKAAAREIVNLTQTVKMNAVRDNTPWRVNLNNPGANQFTLEVDPNNDGNFQVVQTANVSRHGSGMRLLADGQGTCGAATSNWSNDAINQAATVRFNGRGFGNNRTVFLEDIDVGTCYAVTATLAGAVRLRRYDGTVPFSVNQWE